MKALKIKAAVVALCFAVAASASGCASNGGKAGNNASNKPDKQGIGTADSGSSAVSPSSPEPAGTGSQGSNKSANNDNRGAKEPYTIRARLTSFQWIDAKTGYAWGSESNAFRLYRTDDGGSNWAEVTPKGAQDFNGDTGPGRSVYFLDKNHGWISVSREGKPNLVFRTADGGRTWQSSSLDKATYAAAIFFLNKDRGWLMTSSDAAMGSTEKTLYATADGGVNWKAVSAAPLPGGGNTPKQGGLPLSGVTAGITFVDNERGWLTLTSPAEVPILYRTMDGGYTWKETKLALPAQRKGNAMNFAGAPSFLPDDHKHGMILVSGFEGDTRVLDAYVTDDGGESWSFKLFGVEQAVSFADIDHGWSWKNGMLYRTDNGGTSWSELPADSVLADKLKVYGEPLAMQFVSKETGWLLLGSSDGKKSLLLKTEDGAVDWSVQ